MKRLNQKIVIDRFRKVHGDLFDYFLVGEPPLICVGISEIFNCDVLGLATESVDRRGLWAL
jgi:hypothetical protein